LSTKIKSDTRCPRKRVPSV